MIRRVFHGVLVLGLCTLAWNCGGAKNDRNSASGGSTTYASNGARIYYEARNSTGAPVLASREFGEPASPALRSCADCHGADGAGGVIESDSERVRTPSIQYARLTAADPSSGVLGYTDASLALTLRTGVRVDGDVLSPVMPRWNLSTQDMTDLIEHLKTLGPPPGTR